MKPARITLLTSGPLCRNPRVLKEATSLGNHGHEVTVVSVARHADLEACDTELLRSRPFRKVVVDRVAGDRFTRLRSFAERALARALREAGRQHPASLGPYHALRRLATARPWDLLIAHTELPFCIAAELLAAGRPVAADVEDWHSRDLLESARATRPLRLIASAEGALLRGALSVTTTSRPMAEALAAAYEAPVPVVLPNVFPISPAPSFDRPDAPPGIIWFSQTIGPGRGLEAFLAAWSLTRADSRLTLLGNVSDAYRDSLLAAIPPGRRARLEFHPLVPPDHLPELLARHRLGLALEPSEPENKDLTVSNKLFQYLDAGLAVLATPTAGQSEVLARAPAAGLLDDLRAPGALARKLDALLAEPGRLAVLGKAARAAAERDFCWEKHEPALLASVDAALSRARPLLGTP